MISQIKPAAACKLRLRLIVNVARQKSLDNIDTLNHYYCLKISDIRFGVRL